MTARMFQTLRVHLTICLTMCLALTSVSAAVARGQPTPVGMLELCRGIGTMVVHVDADGSPVGPVHLCPDIALSLMSAVHTDDRAVAPVRVWLRVAPDWQARIATSVQTPRATARGPPLSI